MTGLNAALPISLSQIWSRMRVVDRALEAAGDERLGDAPAALARRCRPARRSRSASPRCGGSRRARRSRSSSRRRSRSRLRRDRARRSRRRDRRDSSTVPSSGPPVRLEVPPGNPVLRRDQRARRASAAAPRSRRELRQAVRLQADERRRPRRPIAARSSVAGGCASKSPRGLSTRTPSLLHRAQVLAARDQGHVRCRRARAPRRRRRRSRRRRGPRTSSRLSPRAPSPTRLRCTLPVGVRGIASSDVDDAPAP